MRKKIFALITVIALVAVLVFGLVACNTSGNGTGQDDDFIDNSRGDKISNENDLLEYSFWDTYSAWIVSGIGDYTEEELTIPQTYRGLDVIAIGVEAFKGCTTLRSVVIHDNIQYIRNSAFQDCTKLEKIALDSNSDIMVYPDAFENTAWYNNQPKGVVYLDGIALNYKGEMPNDTHIELKNDTRIITCGAFYECPNLKSIKLNKNLRIIGEDAFEKCTNLSEVDASQCDVNYIAWDAFTGTAWLTNQDSVVYIGNTLYKYNGTMPDNTKIEIKDGTTRICRDAFYKCTGLTSITIPDSVVRIEDYAFEECTGLKEIKGGNGVEYIGANVFRSYPDSPEYISKWVVPWLENQPNGLVYLGKAGYAYVGEMPANTEIEIKDGTTQICGYAFYGCAGLTKLTIPDSVTNIGGGVFEGCTSLTSIKIPNSVTEIASSVFYGCSGLTSINVGAKNKKYHSDGNCIIETESKTLIAGCKNSVIPADGSVTSIGSSAFSNCIGLTSITIPNGVTKIGAFAFGYCPDLTNVTISDSVVGLATGVFYKSTALKNVTLGNSIKDIHQCAFDGCTSLESITIPNSVESIGVQAFQDCVSMASIAIPDSVTDIKYAAFRDCTGIKSIIATSAMASSIIKNNNDLSDVELTITGDEIGSSAFSGCTALKSVTTGDAVTSIGNLAFSDCTNLTSITMPNGLISIGESAFYRCTGLKDITIPNSVTSVGSSAFTACTNLKNNEYDNAYYLGTQSNPYLILIRAKDTSVTSCNVNENCKVICGGAFDWCDDLTSITMPNGLISIGESAFYRCTGLKDITIPNSVTSIGSSAFEDCASLTSVVLSNSVTEIGSSAFEYCANLTNITIPDSVTSIGSSAFEYCANLTNITIPDSVTSIGYSAFSGCIKLNIVVEDGNQKYHSAGNCLIETESKTLLFGNFSSEIPADGSVTTIGSGAFGAFRIPINSMTIGITSITIPDSITSISIGAFDGTVKCVNYTGDIAGWCAINGLDGLMVHATTLYINGNKVEGDLTIPDSVTSIGESSFRGCDGLTSVIIPNSVTEIGSYAFSGCTNLKSVTIPNSVTSIGYCAFDDAVECVNYTGNMAEWCAISGLYYLMSNDIALYINGNKVEGDLIIPTGITSIGDSSFRGCDGLTCVTISNSVTEIGSYAFSGCTNLKSVTIPNSVTSIDSTAFAGCSALESITVAKGNTKYHSDGNCIIATESKTLIVGCKNSVIPTDGSVTTIGDNAFRGCVGLTSITIPDCVVSIGDSAFYGITSLTITIPDSVTEIGSRAFVCENLNVLIGGLVENRYVLRNAFDYCENTTITIRDSVAKIPDNAFSFCYGVSNIVISDGITEIGKEAFERCRNLTSVTIPVSVTSIGEEAFAWCEKLNTIIFGGTDTQWAAISKGSDWDENIGEYTIYCTDGTIAKDGAVSYYSE